MELSGNRSSKVASIILHIPSLVENNFCSDRDKNLSIWYRKLAKMMTYCWNLAQTWKNWTNNWQTGIVEKNSLKDLSRKTFLGKILPRIVRDLCRMSLILKYSFKESPRKCNVLQARTAFLCKYITWLYGIHIFGRKVLSHIFAYFDLVLGKRKFLKWMRTKRRLMFLRNTKLQFTHNDVAWLFSQNKKLLSNFRLTSMRFFRFVNLTMPTD